MGGWVCEGLGGWEVIGWGCFGGLIGGLVWGLIWSLIWSLIWGLSGGVKFDFVIFMYISCC